MAVGEGPHFGQAEVEVPVEHLGVDHKQLEAPKKACVGQVIRERETDVGRLERETSFMVGRLAVSLTGW